MYLKDARSAVLQYNAFDHFGHVLAIVIAGLKAVEDIAPDDYIQCTFAAGEELAYSLKMQRCSASILAGNVSTSKFKTVSCRYSAASTAQLAYSTKLWK